MHMPTASRTTGTAYAPTGWHVVGIVFAVRARVTLWGPVQAR
jgi:hypothetical protein